MSILIKGMEIPTSCYDCNCFIRATACGYRCWDGKEWRDCDKHGRPK